MSATTVPKSWVLILVFAIGTSVSSLVAGHYGTQDSCREAAKAAEGETYPPTMSVNTICLPAE